MATIVQNYGPIYGEVVNGTVQGRPNGSVYTPLTNTIVLTLAETYRYFKPNGSKYRFCDSNGDVGSGVGSTVNFSAESQDLASYIRVSMYTDSACTDLIMYRDLGAGVFNGYIRDLTVILDTPEEGETYYLRAQLMNNSVPVATSVEVIPVEYVSV